MASKKRNKQKRDISVEKIGEEAEVKIFNDVTGFGEVAKSISNVLIKLIDGLNKGAKMFIISMLIILVPIILVPYLKVPGFDSYRFDIIFTVWFIVFISIIIVYFWFSVIKSKDN
jgi:hypothetical protein